MRPTTGSLIQTTAFSIATILGTGILGLPVTLHASGFTPFLLTFTINLVAQIGVVIATVELLQRSHLASGAGTSTAYQAVPTFDDDIATPAVSSAEDESSKSKPSLHSLSSQFLSRASVRFAFEFLVMLHFLSVISAYSLAGPQALVSLIPALGVLPAWARVVTFVIICALAVLVFEKALNEPLTLATGVKATLLSVLVGIILVRGLSIQESIANDWGLQILVDPFLMGSFALNGVVNLMPVTFQNSLEAAERSGDTAPLDAAFIRGYRWATITGVVICYVLNVAWCLAILLCVPQGKAGSQATLWEASDKGEISTIPLVQVLKGMGDPMDGVIAFLANLFIAVSVTVSFMVMSMGMKHYIDGTVSHSSRFGDQGNKWVKYLASYGFILTVAVGNPQALIKIMEGITSFSLNMEAGVFILLMLYGGQKVASDIIPAPLSRFHTYLLITTVGFYFTFAVLVDAIFYLPKTFMR